MGISVHKANLNADFEGNQGSNSFGFDASHASLKYPYRRMGSEDIRFTT